MFIVFQVAELLVKNAIGQHTLINTAETVIHYQEMTEPSVSLVIVQQSTKAQL